MMLSDVASVIAGSAISIDVFGSIVICKREHFIALNKNWQEIEVKA
jgi:hypothetical protein